MKMKTPAVSCRRERGDGNSDVKGRRRVRCAAGSQIRKAGGRRAFSVRLSPAFQLYILYLRRRLSAIMAMNSEFVGLPREFWIVYPK